MKNLLWSVISTFAFASVIGCDNQGNASGETGLADSDAPTEVTLVPKAFDAAAVPTMLSEALTRGDSATVQALLDDKVLVFESGGVEKSFAEYAETHMHADMDFLKTMRQQPISQQLFEFDDHALIASRTRVSGTYKDKPLKLMNTETLLLQRSEDGNSWRIRHIHWSSGKLD
ncbi:MAG: YybH family protein [Oceanococcus sp.]